MRRTSIGELHYIHLWVEDPAYPGSAPGGGEMDRTAGKFFVLRLFGIRLAFCWRRF
jgi:hypothetical protein